jgi:serine/threonine-protein kinase
MLLKPGEVLRERYRVIGLLGQGGMAAVYCAHDRMFDRLVAIKQLRPDPFATDKAVRQARAQFQREAQILATLDHANLPRVTDYFDLDGLEYLVMDYVEGQTLSDVVEKHGGGLDEALVLEWADQLLSALEYIHRHGIIHRDVKPSNIRLTPDGRIYLVDFGLVKLFDTANPKTATMMHGLGTPEYAPPEQYDARLGHTDPRSDVYALGATLYHLLTGYAPATATQRVADPGSFRPLRSVGASVSADIERAILRAMELPRAQRFTSAAEMREVLKRARRQTASEGGLTRRLPEWTGPVRTTPARRAASVAAVVLVLGLGAIGLAGQAESAALSPTPGITPTPTPTAPPASDTPSPTSQPSRTPAPRLQSSGLPLIDPIDLMTPRRTSPTPSPTASPSQQPTATPTDTATSPPIVPPRRPTSTPTPTPRPTDTLEPSDTPSPTPETPRPTPTAASTDSGVITTPTEEPTLAATP